MEFCPNCGSRLEPKKIQKGKEVTLVLVCVKCNYTKQPVDKKAESKVGKVIQQHTTSKPAMTIITEEDQKTNILPTIKMKCDQCGNNECFVWQVQTRGGDEASTQFMRCTKCNHTFREYT
jgi:transcription factor S